MNLELKGKRVLITGASRGIGAATAQRFLEEGAKVVIVSRGSDQLYKTRDELINQFKPNNILCKKCDCSNLASIQLLKEYIDDLWGGIDIVVANVGDGRSVEDPMPEIEQWNKTWSNNFDAAHYIAHTFLPVLKETKGVILFVSSIAAIEAFGAPTDYSTAKSAVIALAKNMARKLAPDVRVNVVAPGNVYFKGGSWDEKIKKDQDRVDELIKNTVPMNRFSTPEEIADSVLFLCSVRASFITGTTLVVDGGQTVGVF